MSSQISQNTISLQDYRLICDLSPASMIVTTPHTDNTPPQILYVNKSFEKLCGYSKDELIGKSPAIFQGSMSNKKELRGMVPALIEGKMFQCNTVNYRKDGSSYNVKLSITPVSAQHERALLYVGILEPQEPKSSMNQLCAQAIKDSKDDIAVLDSDGRFLYVNEAHTRRYGYHNEEIKGMPANLLKSGKHTNEFYQNLWTRLQVGLSVKELFINKTKSGELVYEEQTISPVKENGRTIGFVSIGRDLKKSIDRENMLRQQALYDQLTKVYNRHGINKHIDLAYKQYLLTQTDYVIIMVDIDHFKIINDTYGHQTGDEVLSRLADYLQVSVRNDDIVGRWGGEEFIILLKTNMNNARYLCETIHKRIRKLRFSHEELIVTASFGFAPFDGTGIDMVISNADKALYEAKKKGRDCIVGIDELLCAWRCKRNEKDSSEH